MNNIANFTRITTTDIDASTCERQDIVTQLSRFLATNHVLALKTLNYHWNVKGPNFHSLHAMFEEQYKALIAASDEAAERIRALGKIAPASFREYLELSDIKEDTNPPDNSDYMVKNLLQDNEQASLTARKTLQTAEEAGDEVTVDMMVERMAYHDKVAWMLRSILE